MPQPRYAQRVVNFHGRSVPNSGAIVGYGAVIDALQLPMPMPLRLAVAGGTRRRKIMDNWSLFPEGYEPSDTLHAHIVFALKYEGIDLLFFKRLFDTLEEKAILDLLIIEPTGQYARRLGCLYEWLTGRQAPLPDLAMKNYVPLLDPDLQFAVSGTPSPRHRIINNLPGTPAFCPLVWRTPALATYIAAGYAEKKDQYLGRFHTDVMQRAAAFLLLKDSKASFAIEGEHPRSQREARWGQAIGQAGRTPLSRAELERLQAVVIESARFTAMGYRKQGGFVGEHDRISGEPLPDHISARWQDVEQLMDGLIAAQERMVRSDMDAVVVAAMIAFGFVFIHPFVDGNGRLHRYLVHHVLASKGYHPPGMIFPVSAAILQHMDQYRNTLESYSKPLLDHIEWKPTADNNVEVLNATIDLYRYFDATPQAEFLYAQVADTIERIIPEEVDYLLRRDELKKSLDDTYEMPDKTVDLLIRFLVQCNGKLSERALKKEFEGLTKKEVKDIEARFAGIFKP
ncbi:MAG: Fic family protein [Flavobacteriales bacterium]|nr:Fic family protein [Flavobacteriales bacterium]